MFDEMKKIVMQGKEYPIKCDLLVLEKLQQEFGSLNDFENGLITMEEIKEEKMAEEAGDLEQELQRELGVEPEEKKEEENKKYKVKFPDMKCVKAALYYMVNEGEEIEAEREGSLCACTSKLQGLWSMGLWGPCAVWPRRFHAFCRAARNRKNNGRTGDC